MPVEVDEALLPPLEDGPGVALVVGLGDRVQDVRGVLLLVHDGQLPLLGDVLKVFSDECN